MTSANSNHTVITDENVEDLVRASYLAAMTSESVVESTYKTPPQLFTAIKLTQRGSRFAKEVKGEGIDHPDRQLAVFLMGWSGDEYLVDLEKTDLHEVREILANEIRRRKVVLPWVYGRKLYDKIADSPFHGDSYPTEVQVSDVLKELPQGVFQLGPYISGPLGLLESPEWRYIRPTNAVRAYHCEEVDCDVLHRVHLATPKNPVSRARVELRDKLSRSTKTDPSNDDVVWRFTCSKLPPYEWDNSDDLPYFLFDCFGVEEIQTLLIALLETSPTSKALRDLCAANGKPVKAARQFVMTLDEATLLQILLCAENQHIQRVLTDLVWQRKIAIPEGETRWSKMAPRGGSGPLKISLESSSLGVRQRPSRPMALLRLKNLVSDIYYRGAGESTELRWRLRQFEGASTEEKFTRALADVEPKVLVETLLAANEDACIASYKALNLPVDYIANRNDRELTETLTWHLGFPVEGADGDLASLEEGIARLKMIVRSLPAHYADRTDFKRMQEVAGSLFPALERALKRTLSFSVWALLHDHYANGYDLSYTPELASNFTLEWINAKGLELGAKGRDFTLGDLLAIFGVFSQELKKIDTERSQHARPQSTWPRAMRAVGNPFVFPFQHLYPFLDLDQNAAQSLIDTFQRLSHELQHCGTLEVRNGLLHDKEELPSLDTILQACEGIGNRLGDLVDRGIYPTEFLPAENEGDNFGRDRFVLRSLKGTEVVLLRPSQLHLSGFPRLADPQLVYSSARLQGTGEPLRFEIHQDSSYRQRWQNFPRRPARSKATRGDSTGLAPST